MPPSPRGDCERVPNRFATACVAGGGSAARMLDEECFINGLPSQVRGLLWSSTRMEILTLRELLERARGVLVDTEDEHLVAAARPKQVSLTPDLRETSQSGHNCFRCKSPNHLAKDCIQRRSVRNWRERSTTHCYLCNKTEQSCEKLSGETEMEVDVSTTLSPIKLKEVLPVIEAVVDGKKRIALVDSGCSRFLVTRSVCNPSSWQISDILTVKGEILHSGGVGTIMLAVDNVSPVKADVLVVDSPLSSFDMLIGMDNIRMMGGVRVISSIMTPQGRSRVPALRSE